DRALFTFELHSIAKSTQSSTQNNEKDKNVDEVAEEEEEEEEDPHVSTLVHGSPSKKDFLDKLKALKQSDIKEGDDM
ncbi:unnamed protein product, partial [Rotaria magnacalcarata]